MADALAAAGADIIGVSASIEDSGSEVASKVHEYGRSFTPRRADIGDRSAVRELAAWLNGQSRPIDILVNNAGTIRRAPAEAHTDEDWHAVLEVDLSAQFVLAREIGREMLRRGSGKIIFTASMLSFQGGVTVPGYAAAKSGIAGLTRALANEWAGRGVNVNAIAPGTSLQTTPEHCASRRTGTRPSSTAYPRDDGGKPKTWAAPSSSSPRTPPATYTARFFRSTVGGSRARRSAKVGICGRSVHSVHADTPGVPARRVQGRLAQRAR
jgi:NAD(P)-dependent dehydrogenase (short-subunit alcohol dehydrogenase family)